MEDNEFPRFIQEKIEKEKNFGQLVTDIKNDLRNSDRYKPFFEKYNSRSIESFIESYAFKKASYLTYGQWYIEREHEEMLKYRLIAEERIWEIQQKKLFNLQCMWRAEMVGIPEIESTFDFEYWERTIENCGFLDPISEDEFQLYKEYILSDEYDDWEWRVGSWQSYSSLKSFDDDDDEIPAWYGFYDHRKGTGSLLQLPDIRGEKEEFYMESYREDYRKKISESTFSQLNSSADRRPYISAYDRDVIEGFMNEFESSKLFEYYMAYEKNIERSADDDLELAIEVLQEAEEEVPMEAHQNWRMAILTAARKYEQKKISEALDGVYKDYLNRLKLGIAFEIHEKESQIRWYKEFSETMKSHIKKGRELNGEPPDFNF